MIAATDLSAPGYAPDAVDLPWYRRALAQGAGYFLPSVLFVAIPLLFTGALPWFRLAMLLVLLPAIGALFVGSTLVMHWSPGARWLWLLALAATIVATGVVTRGATRPAYFAAYITTTAAALIAWRHARFAIVGVAVVALGVSAPEGDLFGVIMAMMAFALGISMGLGLENARTHQALQRAEERTAVLAVAAERERIGRDLHDILGHSLTAIAVKADLAGRLVGRDDAAARAEIESLGVVVRQALADVRSTASGMREVRLAPEIAAARSVLEAAGIECRAPSALPALSDQASELLGYAVREGVTNVVRHSGATRCEINVDEHGVLVTDNGRGMPSGARRSGLRGLADRLAQAGGSVDLVPDDTGATGTDATGTGGSGTRLRARLSAEANGARA